MDFQENFLHTIWKYQYFDKKNLQTTTGQNLEINKIGFHNFHEGPDFLEAQIQLGTMQYHGNIEIHRKSSDWISHGHSDDENYNAVMLHVVFEHDRPILRSDGTEIPTLELKGRIFLEVIRNYERLSESKDEILCGSRLQETPEIIRYSMLEKSLVERLELKSDQILYIMGNTKNDWEETAYRWLFRCFGFKTNAETMFNLAKSIPYKILKKQGDKAQVIEAILFGQAGLLPVNGHDAYSHFLVSEYGFYQKKYGLKPALSFQDWKFMGVRPGNFPYRRIAQLAKILAANSSLFSVVLDCSKEIAQFRKMFDVNVDVYWQHHIKPGIISKNKLASNLSKNTFDLLIINFISPLWYSYGKFMNEVHWKEKGFELLQDLNSENNFISRKFEKIGWHVHNAFDSQGMLGLYHNYCREKRCMDCKIGQNLLKPPKVGLLV
ncbi:DUF2851 family protein [Cecembia lonarensis]|uniref:DUF2851 domain-containing protein n=1 Tax=Cecembia lonarensis (strain CCUG 58316 / KCTC 22772 / LW9) TaxID=1225176 RepID=K1M107_CECL9|nr:DUF2851 family protein [Cecembia lonarensis]EKB50019.1 hypothetical protein B879_01301 [Cecembia lonarensis LW9]